ncbi:hypothetical protein ACFVIL_43555 [Streptomyces sp. NPDC127159]|uniref:hypothetical protein n=1 Tax=unclassified Streptomyces TaxID=2593676 RepID=UPI003630B97B
MPLLRYFNSDLVRERHRRWPILESYDVDLRLHPYLTHMYPPNYRSSTFNTDGEGFRVSHFPSGCVDSESWPDVESGGLLTGASTAFGAGVTSDRKTIASNLAFKLDLPVLNLGFPGANSYQQLVAVLPHIDRARFVAFVSGWIPLVAHLRSGANAGGYEPLYYQRMYQELSKDPLFDLYEVALRQRQFESSAPPDSMATSSPIRDRSRSDFVERMRLAIRTQRRDLSLIKTVMGPHRQVVFGLQPLCHRLTRKMTDEEIELSAFHREMFGDERTEFELETAKIWPQYASEMKEMCGEIGVDFVELAAEQFEGWSFFDSTHFTDLGAEQTASFLAKYIT